MKLKTLLLVTCLGIGLAALSGCTKEPEAAKPVTPPADVQAGTAAGGPKVQSMPAGATSNQ
jgi:outer membrane protein assembly factor BamE (lipoprotein component of BamABCDE complex)